jgi:hypothetical protein
MRLAEVPSRLSDASSIASEKISEGVEAARRGADVAYRGAQSAYRLALEHPKTSIGAIVVSAVLVGGLLWYMFGTHRKPLERRSKGPRVRAVSERRRRSRHARAAA